MSTPNWTKSLANCADPQRARHFFALLSATEIGPQLLKLSADHVEVLTALFSGSPALSNLLIANPDWFPALDLEHIRHPRRKQGLHSELNGWLKPLLGNRDHPGAYARLRRFKQQQMLRIATRDLARLARVVEITQELSDVADVCLESVWQICREQFTTRFGQPYHQDAGGQWCPTAFCVLGMGKLGGQELNYSSDVDVLFVYSEEGQVFKEPPGKRKTPSTNLSNHQFFNRLAECFIAEVSRMTDEGALYRIDLRLRPEGDAGPLCRSLGSYENYYAQWGQTWERMMLIKARGVAGDQALAAEFLEMIQPFRFARSISPRVLKEVAAMKDRIETEVVRAGELDRNVKLGRGGIREIEFIAQSLQLLHAGRQPFLQLTQTLPCLAKLVEYHWLTATQAKELAAAYCFLRDVEHRLQMEENLQTHSIPADKAAQTRLAKLMGFASREQFESARQKHTRNVRHVYDQLLRSETPREASPFPDSFDGAETEWKALLARHWFRDVDKAFRVLREFVEGPGYVHVSPRTVELARQLLPRLFGICRTDDGQTDALELAPKTLSDPDRVVTRLDSFITAYGTRATLFDLWNSNPTFFELLLLLFDRSEFLAESLIRAPELLDDLVFGGRLTTRKTAQEILRDLRHGLADTDQHLWLRRYHAAEFMRLGLRDILGLVDFEQNLAELSALADACLQYALESVMRKHKLKQPPFVIMGLGKLGGSEINYGSDLDVVFVASSKTKKLPALQKLAVEVMDLLSRRTEQGLLFPTDARLRPDGEKGLLVNSLSAYEEYYRHRAQLWEIQSLTRVRSVAGDARLGEQFQQLAARLTNFSRMEPELHLAQSRGPDAANPGRQHNVPPTVPACWSPGWKQEIHAMRLRIEKERTPIGQDQLAIKTGKGGLMDAEFVAQTMCLEHGWQEPHTLRALERAHTEGVLPDGGKLLENYRQLRRVEGILRRWSYEGETVLPEDPAPYYRVSVRCGFATPGAFAAALAKWRAAIREVYAKVFAV